MARDMTETTEAGVTPQRSPRPSRRHYRSLFVSDVHLGARSCQPDRFLDFLHHTTADEIYLVGDMFDSWQPIGKNWSPVHDAIVQVLLARAEQGARLVYLPGNHDAFFRRHYGTYFDRVEVTEQAIHTAADGRRYLVVHGDCCDAFIRRARWLSRLASHIDGGLRGLSALVNRVRGVLGMDEFIVIERAILRFNSLLRYGNRFERRLARLARDCGAEGVICGHFHKPALHDDFGVIYANCGDWVHSFTAIAEGADGGLRLVQWAPEAAPVATDEALPDAEDAPTMVI